MCVLCVCCTFAVRVLLSQLTCTPTDTGFYVNAGITALDCLVLLSSSLSILVCVRSLIRTFYFQKKLRCFFKQKYNYSLKWKDSLPLFNMWFVGVLISSALAIIGSLMKVILSYQASFLRHFVYINALFLSTIQAHEYTCTSICTCTYSIHIMHVQYMYCTYIHVVKAQICTCT